MRHELGEFTFSAPDDWRDRTPYCFGSKDGRTTLIVEQTAELLDEPHLVERAMREFLSVWQPAVIYVNDATFRRRAGARSPGIEGAQHAMVATAPPFRFAKVAIATATRSLVLHFFGPSTGDFLPLVRSVVESVELEGKARVIVREGYSRKQASSIHLCVPETWTSPAIRSFLDAQSDAVRIDVSLEDVLPERGSADFGRTILEHNKILEEHTVNVRRPPLVGWSSEWLLEHELHPFLRIARRECVGAPSGRSLTVVGGAPQADRAALDRGWQLTTTTLAPKENPRG